MTKPPKMTAALRKERLADVSSKRDTDMTTNSDEAMEPSRSVEMAPSVPASPAPAKTLPKVTLYAHADVLKAIRLLAVEDGVQAQEILRRAVRDYLATRGHHFTDLATGEQP